MSFARMPRARSATLISSRASAALGAGFAALAAGFAAGDGFRRAAVVVLVVPAIPHSPIKVRAHNAPGRRKASRGALGSQKCQKSKLGSLPEGLRDGRDADLGSEPKPLGERLEIARHRVGDQLRVARCN